MLSGVKSLFLFPFCALEMVLEEKLVMEHPPKKTFSRSLWLPIDENGVCGAANGVDSLKSGRSLLLRAPVAASGRADAARPVLGAAPPARAALGPRRAPRMRELPKIRLPAGARGGPFSSTARSPTPRTFLSGLHVHIIDVAAAPRRAAARKAAKKRTFD